MMKRGFLTALVFCLLLCGGRLHAEPSLRLLFLGDDGPHRPARRFQQLAPVLEKRGISLEYTEDIGMLDGKKLARFDAVVLYANIDRIEPARAGALLEYVAAGGGFVPLHSASYCFRNAPELVALIGGQFKRHEQGVFTTRADEPDHPIMRGFGGFVSWDESYIHTAHNKRDRVVLEYREEGPQEEGRQREPWTWVRTHGRGRVFYTAWGHDQRTWGHAGFHNLVERGIRWVCRDDPSVAGSYVDSDRFVAPPMKRLPADGDPFEYQDVGPKIPNYTPGAKWGEQGKTKNMMQTPLSPAESIKRFVVPEGFAVHLFAAEPDLGGKPITMNWDPRGRLWVAETYDYPNQLQAVGQGRDRIRICEDTDGDGRADKFTVFADHLSIPTAITFWRGGAVVQNGTQTLYLKDTDGDDRADVREVLMTGWSLGDTHGGVSNFRYGLDNWIWAMQGYNDSSPKFDGAPGQSFRMGFFRFRLSQTDPPKVEQLEFIRSTNNNTWGLGFSEEGIIFGSTANRNPSVYMPIANRYYERVRGWSPEQLGTIADTHRFAPVTGKVRQVDHHGGYTAGAGHALYTARNFPRPWWNKIALVCGPTGHLVGTFVLRRDGADFHSTSPGNLLASDDEWSAPIMAEVGPDGNVWVIDWYNYIVQHNPTPHGFETGGGNAYVSSLRDKKHGRIYRVVYDPASGVDKPSATTLRVADLGRAAAGQLVAALTNPTMLCRLQAQRLLVQRGEGDVVPELVELIRDESVDEIDLNVGAIHAIATLAGLGALRDPSSEGFVATTAALSHPSPGVRRGAASALPRGAQTTETILQHETHRDPDAQVRLAALLALSDAPPDETVGHLLAELATDISYMQDRWLSDAVTSAAATHAMGFLTALAERSAPRHSTEVVLGEKALTVARIVAEHVSRGKPPAGEVLALATTLADADPRLIGVVLDGVAAGWPRTHSITLPEEAEATVMTLLDRAPMKAKSQLIRLASLWGSQALTDQVPRVTASLLDAFGDEAVPLGERISAARQLIEFRPADDQIVDALLAAVTPQAPPDLAAGVLDTLVACRAESLGAKLVTRAADATPTLRAAVIRVLLARRQTTDDLLSALETGRFQRADLSLEQRQMLAHHPREKIRERATRLLDRGGGLPDPDRLRVVQEKLALLEQSGDVAQGATLFKKHCGKCHRHSGEGEAVGPDLTGMAVHPKEELLTQILDPSRSVEGNFRIYTVVTDAGRIYSGMLAGETRSTIELIDVEAKRQVFRRDEIEQLVASRKSLMPDGFEKELGDAELVDLLEFLTDKGRFLPIPLDKFATIVSTRGMFYSKDATVERLIFPDWKPKTFAGVPFVLVDPQGDRAANVIMLYGPRGKFPPQMPKTVSLPCRSPARAVHLLGAVSGWGAKGPTQGGVSLIVRLHYGDGQSEDHPLIDGQHFADYIGVFDVPQSQLAFKLRNQQVRYLSIEPRRTESIETIELIKGPDQTAPLIVAVTVETLP